MELYYWQGEPNFGDRLNPWLWKRLLPGAIGDGPGDDLLVGIGTLLNSGLSRHPKRLKRVMGTGVGYLNAPPRLDDSWKIYFVRGPLSAKALGIDERLAVTDGAILAKDLLPKAPRKKAKFGFVPHWEHRCPGWRTACAELGIQYIDPFSDVETVAEEISGVEVLLAEAMHGAILADLLRTPWVAVKSSRSILGFKWQDWCASVGARYEPHQVTAPFEPSRWIGSRIHARIKRELARNSLKRLVQDAKPQLSEASRLESLSQRAQECLAQLRADLR